MSRAIRLTQLHALNWYGYRDSLPVQGNLVLAGVTGSGKSILMDLLMLVLVGPERAHHHFNRSATGSKAAPVMPCGSRHHANMPPCGWPMSSMQPASRSAAHSAAALAA